MPGLKSTAKRLAKPVFMPVWRRVWVRVENRIAAAEAQLASTQAEAEARFASALANQRPSEARLAALEAAWHQHVPSFLNAVGTVSAFGHELARFRHELARFRHELSAQPERMQAVERRLEAMMADERERLRAEHSATMTARIDEFATRLDHSGLRLDNTDASVHSLWERIEFVRREILFEMQHGGHGDGSRPPVAGTAAVTPRVIAADKVAAARAASKLRLNLGCGHITLADYVNVDMRELPGVDVVAEAGNLPFEPGDVAEIHSAHLLEHFPQEAIRRRLLPYWHSILRSGGVFRAVTPDAAAMLSAAGSGTYSFEDFREVVFGAQDYAGDYHYNLFTPDSLTGLLAEAGFKDIEVPVAGRRNGKCFEFEIVARRP